MYVKELVLFWGVQACRGSVCCIRVLGCFLLCIGMLCRSVEVLFTEVCLGVWGYVGALECGV